MTPLDVGWTWYVVYLKHNVAGYFFVPVPGVAEAVQRVEEVTADGVPSVACCAPVGTPSDELWSMVYPSLAWATYGGQS